MKLFFAFFLIFLASVSGGLAMTVYSTTSLGLLPSMFLGSGPVLGWGLHILFDYF